MRILPTLSSHRIIPALYALFILALAPVPGVAAQDCIESVENHTWIVPDSVLAPVAESGAVVRAYSPRGVCVGESIYEAGTNMGLAVAGQTPQDEAGMEPGEEITFHVDGALVTSFTVEAGDATTYSPDGLSRIIALTIADVSVGWSASEYVVEGATWSAPIEGVASGPIGLADLTVSGPIDSLALPTAIYQERAANGAMRAIGMADTLLDGSGTVAIAYGTVTDSAVVTITSAHLVEADSAGADLAAELAPASATIRRSVPGDLNGDYVVSASDYVAGTEHLLGLTTLPAEALERGDLDDSGTFTRRDLWMIFWMVRQGS